MLGIEVEDSRLYIKPCIVVPGSISEHPSNMSAPASYDPPVPFQKSVISGNLNGTLLTLFCSGACQSMIFIRCDCSNNEF